MYRLGVVLLIVLGVLVIHRIVFRIRERLEPTDKIKAPTGPEGGRNYTPGGEEEWTPWFHYDDQERERIWSFVPDATKAKLLSQYETLNLSENDKLANAKLVVSMIVSIIYRDLYTKATRPLTMDDIHAYAKNTWQMTDQEIQADAYGNLALLKAYFVDQSPPPQAASSAATTESSPAPAAPAAPAAQTINATAPSTITINIR